MANETKFAAPGSISRGDEAMAWQPINELQPGIAESDTEAEAAGPDENWRFWQEQINTALVHERRFRREGLHAENLYFGPENDVSNGHSAEAPNANPITDETGLIHANIDVLKPLIFSETPTPIVQRRWRGDGKSDETDLMAAEAGQRIAQWLISTTDFDAAMERVRDDWLIPGRGVARSMYRAEFVDKPVVDGMTGLPVTDPATGEIAMESVKATETVIIRPCDWRRVVFAPSHGWDEMPWMAFEVPMTRSRIEKRFPDHAARFAYNQKGLKGRSLAFTDDDREDQGLSLTVDRSGDPVISPFDTATVWEIWDRERKQVIWWSPDCGQTTLDKVDDPLQLEHFFPTPKPLLATVRGDSLNPRPDVSYYAERAREIDLATRKMRDLLEVLAVAGLYPGNMADQVKSLMNGKNQLIPMPNWIALLEKGGTSGMIQWLPLEPIITCIKALILMREQAKAAMFEASGVSDIMRAQGDPRETAAAQNLKGRYAGMRLSIKQRRMATYARDSLRIMMEIALEMFDTDRLATICGLDIPITEQERAQRLAEIEAAKAQFAQEMQAYQTLQQAAQAYQAQADQMAQQTGQQPQPMPPLPPAPVEPKFDRVPETSWEMVHERLRNDFMRNITLTIETDSTVLADEQADKDARIEFLGAFATFVQQLGPLMATGQFDMKTVKELLLFGVRAFPKSRTLEGLISQMPDEPQDKGPPPEDTAVVVAKIRAETDKMLEEMRLQDAEKDRQHEMRLKGVDLIADGAKTDARAANEANARRETAQRPPSRN